MAGFASSHPGIVEEHSLKYVSHTVNFLKYYMLLKAFRACGAVHTLLGKLHLRQS